MATDKKSDRDVQTEADAPLKRTFKVACNVQHDGILYAAGTPILCDETLFNELVEAGAIKLPKLDDN